MSKFLVEIEFKTKAGNLYWFPLFITAADKDKAEQLLESVIRALKEQYEVVKHDGPRPVIAGLNSAFIQEYIQAKMLGKTVVLHAHLLKLEELERQAGYSFNQYMQLVDADPEKFSGKVLATQIPKEFPVRCIKQSYKDFDEFLLINIVKP